MNPEKENPLPKPTRAKRSIACNFCRMKKVRCNGGIPCSNCLDHGEVCVSASRRRARLNNKDAANRDMAQRLARVEALLQAAESERANSPQMPEFLRPLDVAFQRTTNVVEDADLAPRESSTASPHSQFLAQTFNKAGREESLSVPNLTSPTNVGERLVPNIECGNTCTVQPSASHRETSIPDMDFTQDSTMALRPMNVSEAPEALIPDQIGVLQPDIPPPDYQTNPMVSSNSSPSEKQEVNSVYSCESSNWEYHGPRSFLSICSKPGIQWVSQKIGTSTFHDAAGTLTRDVTRRLKIEKKLSKERTPEPPASVAWKYAQAYFERAPDAVFGVVDKSWFNARLQNQLNNPGIDEDPAWYALRNAVYAVGCRLELSRRANFREAYRTAWSYFENALAVHTELLYFRTSLLAVQALTVMAYYTECIGSPCLEYMLVTNAARLAYSKGLHRQPVPSWDLSSSEQCHRNWLFWAIYCLEKNCCCRAGRPSAINDDEISCQIPTVAPAGAPASIQYPTSLVKLAQMTSRVARVFSNVQNWNKSPDVLADTVEKLHAQHVETEKSLQDLVNPEIPLENANLPLHMSLQQACFVRLTYFNTTLDIHTALTNPWSHLRQHPTIHAQVQKSTEIVARTVRATMLTTQSIRIDASTPVLLAFQTPIYAFINLFIHILQNPDLPTVPTDLALLEVGAGHFARLEFATESEVPIVFAKEVAALARQAVKNHKAFPQPSFGQPTDYNEFGVIQEKNVVRSGEAERDTIGSPLDSSYSNMFDFELDHWTTFLPLHDP
ncbi:uncharacterized protein PV07_02832 [Cladophialophora immunda]|uniref:Zn(2)-C6 fungal-type domain-containing protein n=1 Tax=Cladophialophora immunda TaxID=569365 RepID=A0A0D2CJ41_9EURO|nr:uncharacterized protein PV07_02832 [Cladophialophora immunda]KIW31163.1 hypothetical protein PV07_02832 [Cladophialophora immunda]